jgi:hypothetical protein
VIVSSGRFDPAVQAAIHFFIRVVLVLELVELHGPDVSLDPIGCGIIEIDDGGIRPEIVEPAPDGVGPPALSRG